MLNTDKVIIAGNGPSLASIDYSKLPESFDVFRCNQFYFEDKYYLGKKIKKVFFRPSVFFEQYFTIHHIIGQNEYSCEEIVFAGNDRLDKYKHGRILNYAVDVVDGYDKYISTIQKFDVYKNFNTLYYGKYISMGVYMCAVAVACGYKEIYLAGMDFYDSNMKTYAFGGDRKNINTLIGSLSDTSIQYQNSNNFHNVNTDIDALNFLIRHYGINIFTLSESSAANKYFTLSEHENNIEFIVLEKMNNSIKDILIPAKDAYKRLSADCKSYRDRFIKYMKTSFNYSRLLINKTINIIFNRNK